MATLVASPIEGSLAHVESDYRDLDWLFSHDFSADEAIRATFGDRDTIVVVRVNDHLVVVACRPQSVPPMKFGQRVRIVFTQPEVAHQ